MLTDAERPGLADALRAWEAGDDGIAAQSRSRWARQVALFVADRRAKLRWGMLPLD